jgi:hypothetical protein
MMTTNLMLQTPDNGDDGKDVSANAINNDRPEGRQKQFWICHKGAQQVE